MDHLMRTNCGWPNFCCCESQIVSILGAISVAPPAPLKSPVPEYPYPADFLRITKRFGPFEMHEQFSFLSPYLEPDAYGSVGRGRRMLSSRPPEISELFSTGPHDLCVIGWFNTDCFYFRSTATQLQIWAESIADEEFVRFQMGYSCFLYMIARIAEYKIPTLSYDFPFPPIVKSMLEGFDE